MDGNYFIVDIETCLVREQKESDLREEERKKRLNPVDSKIVAIGIRHNGKNALYIYEEEKKMLEEFWAEWKVLHKEHPGIKVVGFSLRNFDLPFVTMRSFILGVPIAPFLIKPTIDLREKISAYRYGPTRGKLRELAKLTGMQVADEDSSDVERWCKEKNYGKMQEYLGAALEITDALYRRARDTNVIFIERW